MSYIRCLSNPEKLYVFGSGNNTVEWWTPDTPPLIMRDGVFERIMDRYDSYDWENEDDPIIREDDWELRPDSPDFGKYTLITPNGQKLEMWQVTFYYILSHHKWHRDEWSIWYHLKRIVWLLNWSLQRLWGKLGG